MSKGCISIIIRQTSKIKVQRLINQLSKVHVPDGYSVDVQIINGAKSLAIAYNEGMKQAEGEYKVYMDEAVAVLNPTVLDTTIDFFNKHPKAGVIGWYGSEIPIDGDISNAKSIYGTHCRLELNGSVTVRRGKNPIFYQNVEMVDGAVVATRGDIEWDESIGDYFAVAAHCSCRLAIGQEIIVPMQNDTAVCQVERNSVYFLSDLELSEYESQRKIFFETYKKQIQPLVSILIPTYNQPVFVTEALESALSQDYENIEIIIGDDSTNEVTKQIMRGYEKKYPQIQYYYHGGPLGEKGLKNWNFVLNKSHGDYVNYLLHDDLYMPIKISRMMAYYKQDLEGTIGIVTSSRNAIDENGNELAPYMNPWLPEEDTIEEGETIGRRILSFFQNFIGETTTALVRKDDLKISVYTGEEGLYRIGRFFGYVDKSMADVSVWLEMARRGKRCVFIRERLSSFRQHTAQNSHDMEMISRCLQDWLCFAVLAWINEAFFRTVEEFRSSLLTWKKFFLSTRRMIESRDGKISDVVTAMSESVALIENGCYGEACIRVVEGMKKRQPEGGIMIPEYYRERCYLVDGGKKSIKILELAAKNEGFIMCRPEERTEPPLVSVVIPTYSRPHYFKKALDSVLSQTYKNLDIFITDNSKDEKTKELMAEYLEKDSRIKYEHHPEYNADDNWMRARMYDNPEAKYVNWLMDDDVWRPEKIEAMVKIMEEDSEVTIVTSYRRLIDERGELLPDLNSTKCVVEEDAKIDGEEAGGLLIKKTWNYIGEPTTALLRKSAMKNNQLGWTGHEGKYFVSDFPTWLRLLEKGKLVYLKKPYSYFRWHEDNGQKNLNWMLLSAVCWGLCIKHAWESKVFLKTFNDLKEAIGSWMSLTELTYKAIRIADCDETKKADYLAVRRAFNKALVSKGVLELNIDTGCQTG